MDLFNDIQNLINKLNLKLFLAIYKLIEELGWNKWIIEH